MLDAEDERVVGAPCAKRFVQDIFSCVLAPILPGKLVLWGQDQLKKTHEKHFGA